MRNSSLFKCLSLALSAGMVLASCEKEPVAAPESHPFEISAVMDSQSDTRVSMSDTFKLTWDMVKGSENIWVVSKDKVQGSAFEIVRVEEETAVFGSALNFNAIYPYTYGESGWMRSLTFSPQPNAFLCDISDQQVIKCNRITS